MMNISKNRFFESFKNQKILDSHQKSLISEKKALINKKLIILALVVVVVVIVAIAIIRFDLLRFFKELPDFLGIGSKEGDVEEIDLSNYHAVAVIKVIKDTYIYYLYNDVYYKSQLYIENKKIIINMGALSGTKTAGQVYGNKIVIFANYLSYGQGTEEEDVVKNYLFTEEPGKGWNINIKKQFLVEINNAIMIEYAGVEEIFKENGT